MRVSLTDLFCKGAKTRETSGENFWDTKTEGLLLRVLRSGSKVFYFKYRSPVRRIAGPRGAIGWQAGYRIGSYDAVSLKEARRIALRLAADVADGKDPAAERAVDLRRTREARTFDQLGDQWLDEHARKRKVARAVRDDEGMLRNL